MGYCCRIRLGSGEIVALPYFILSTLPLLASLDGRWVCPTTLISPPLSLSLFRKLAGFIVTHSSELLIISRGLE
jgi:hypothetical protein